MSCSRSSIFRRMAAFSTMVLALSSCETVKKSKDNADDPFVLPKFITQAQRDARETDVASEDPLMVTQIVNDQERAAGPNELKLPTRERHEQKEVKLFDYPSSLLRHVNPDQMEEFACLFDETDLTDVVSTFADKLQFDYTLDSQVKGTVTLKMDTKMTNRQIWGLFERILWRSGAYVSRSSELVEVLPFEQMAQMPDVRLLPDNKDRANVHVEFIPIYRAKAAELIPVVKPFLTKGATLQDVKQLNSLLLVETPQNVEKIQQIIRKLDDQWQEDWPQISIRCHSVDTETIIEELKLILPTIGLPAVFGDSNKDGVEVKITDIPRLQVIVASAPMPELLKQIERWVELLDREDIGEQEHIYFYNVRSSSIQNLSEAISTFFNTDVSASPVAKKSVSSNAGDDKNTVRPTTSNRKNSSSRNNEESASRSSVFDVPVTIYEEGHRNRLVIRTTPRAYNLIEALLKRLDVPPLQVLIQATIVDLTLTDGLQFGFRYALQEQSGNWGMNGSIASDGDASAAPPSTQIGDIATATGVAAYFRSGSSAIDFVASVAGRGNTSVLSAPQVIAVSDEQAVIDVSEKISIPDTVYTNSSTTGNNNISYRDEKAGIVLTVTPHVTANNEVSMEIIQEIDEFDEAQLVKYQEGFEEDTTLPPPTVYKRKLETKLVVPDGQTVLLGGMIRNKDNNYEDGVPYLMDIPWLGHLFKYKSKTTRRTELLVLMTVNVVDNSTKLERLLSRYRRSVDALREEFGDATVDAQTSGTMVQSPDGNIRIDYNPNVTIETIPLQTPAQ